MGYYPTNSALPARKPTPSFSRVAPKTHTPCSPMQDRGLRFYNSEIGRWVSRDPIGEKGINILIKMSIKNIFEKSRQLHKFASHINDLLEQYSYVFVLNTSQHSFDPIGLQQSRSNPGGQQHTDCGSVCAMANNIGLLDDVGGTVICYMGTLCPCINSSLGTDPGIAECIMEHEQTHARNDNLTCHPCDWCSTAMGSGSEWAGDECRATSVHLACLINQKSRRCHPGDYVCNFLYDREIQRVQQRLDVLCSLN